MSLAINAAPFNNDHDENLNLLGESVIHQKKNQFRKTQKNKEMEFNSAKVNAVLENFQNLDDSEDNNNNNMGDFKPLAPPTSVGVENTKLKESKSSSTSSLPPTPPSLPDNIANIGNNSNTLNSLNNSTANTSNKLNFQTGETDQVDLQSLKDNFMNKNAVKEYFSNIIPNYNSSHYPSNTNNVPHYKYQNQYNNQSAEEQLYSNNAQSQNDVVITKLNYMINLLEEQQDEKTSHVTEEVILYSFLGIFMIFIVDSFSRVGKYTR